MNLEITSPDVSIDLEPTDGATNQGALMFSKGYVSDDGKRVKFYAAQITDDGKIKIHKLVDRKGATVDLNTKKFNTRFDFSKTGTFSYCERLSANKTCNIFQQSSPTNIWAMIQFDFATGELKKQVDLNHPGGSEFVKLFTRHSNHLYYIVDDSGSEELFYVDLSLFGRNATAVPSWSMSVEADKTDIASDENHLYMITYDGVSDQELQIFNHSSTEPVSPDDTITDIYNSDSYDDFPAEIRVVDNNHLLVRKNGTQLYRISQGESDILTDLLPEDEGDHFRINTKGFLYVEGHEFVQTTGEADKHNDDWYTAIPGIEFDTTVDGILQDLLERVGIDKSDMDFEDIRDLTGYGLKIDGTSVEQAIKEVMTVYNLAMINTDGKIKFTQHGKASSLTIDGDRMGASNSGNVVSSFQLRYGPETETPQSIVVQYTDALDNYEESAQLIKAINDVGVSNVTLDFTNHSLSSTIAKKLADVKYAQLNSEGMSITFTVSTYYFKIVPGDVITVLIDSEDIVFRVTNVNFQYPGLITIMAVSDFQEIWDSNVTGVDQAVPNDPVVQVDTNMRALDIALLSGTNDVNGQGTVYLPASPYGAGTWNGCDVFKDIGVDGWRRELSSSKVATIGYTTEALDAPVNYRYIDYVSTVTAQLINSGVDTLSSLSDSDFATGQGNLALLGTEIIRFQTATPTAAQGEYTLSVLQRGRLGTEQEIDTHDSGEVFVLLQEENFNIATVNLSEEGGTVTYAANTIGEDFPPDDLDDLEADTIDPLAIRSKQPYAPAYLLAVKDGFDWDITFNRRSRYENDQSWYIGKEIPLNEQTEAYEVYVWDGSDKVRTIDLTSESGAYTSAQQVTDFGGVQSSIKMSIAQIGDVDGIETQAVTFS